MMRTSQAVDDQLKSLGTPEKAKASAWFFKTGKGQYGYGDVFYGVTVPEQRKVAKEFAGLSLAEIEKLLKHTVHECRLTGLLILVKQFQKADESQRQQIAQFYLDHLSCVNNWDLVDSSASSILGVYLIDKDRSVLYQLAKSADLWRRRVAIIATAAFINCGQFDDTLRIAELLLPDTHDLIHKAVGWMLREVGKKDRVVEEKFLAQHAATMPRTMLRYAIEKFPDHERKLYLFSKKGT